MGDELDTGAVCASLAACPALQRVTFIVYPPLPRAGLTVACTQLLLRLPRECPHLDLQPLDAGSFFLTHSEDLGEWAVLWRQVQAKAAVQPALLADRCPSDPLPPALPPAAEADE